MAVFQSIEEARTYFQGDHFATDNGIVIDELEENSCVCSMTITDHHRNADGGVMGGAIFTLADFAFAVASNNRHNLTVGQQASVSFLSGSKGNRLIAKARCRKDGRSTCVYNVDVSDDQGRDIAQFTGTGYKI